MAQPVIQNVALFGASGKLGQPLLAAMLKADDFKVTVIARESSTATYPAPALIKKVSDAYTKSEVREALTGQDVVVIAFAHAANAAHHRTIIDAAAEAGVKHLIPNHWGSKAELPIIRDASERANSLDEDIDYLRTKEAQLSWTAIIPGIFFDMAFPYGLLGFNLRDRTVEIWDAGDATFSASTNDDIAQATIAVLRKHEVVRNRYAYTSSFSTSQNQLLEVVQAKAKSSGGQEWSVRKVSRGEKIKAAQDIVAGGAQGMPWMMAQGTLAAASLFGGEEYQSDFERAGRRSNEVLGLRTRNVTDSVVMFL